MHQNALLTQLHRQQQISPVLPQQQHELQQREQSQSLRLAQRNDYLSRYDLLFRNISLWLLARGFALSSLRPHRTLAAICEQWESPADVAQCIATRHGLKKQGTASATLQQDAATLDRLIVHLHNHTVASLPDTGH